MTVEVERQERERLRQLRLQQGAGGALAVCLVASFWFVQVTRRENTRVEANLALAQTALDESLSAIERPGVDQPQLQAFRQELLSRAETFYTALVNQAPRSLASRRDLALAHFRLGHVKRMREKPDEAARAYRDAIAGFQALAGEHPVSPEYRASLAEAYDGLGEALRPAAVSYQEAEQAFTEAVRLQQQLILEEPANLQYQQALARTHYHRGLLRSESRAATKEADIDFREAARLLEPLAARDDRAAQELARAHHGRGKLLAADAERLSEARALFETAIGIDERLVIKDPANRGYKLELATFCNELAALLSGRGDVAEADRRSRMAVDLIESLSRPLPSLAIARADAHNLRGLILQGDDPSDAVGEYELALDLFSELQNHRDPQRLLELHEKLGTLVLNLAGFPKDSRDVKEAGLLLSQAVNLYAVVAANVVSTGSRPGAERALESVARALPALPEPHRAQLSEFHEQLRRRLADARR